MRAELRPIVISLSVEAPSATLNIEVPESPWFDGHFPNQPVLPGIAMVLWAKAAFEEHLNTQVSSDVPRMKFRSLVRPGAELQLRLSMGRRLAFGYHSADGAVVCSGEFSIREGNA